MSKEFTRHEQAALEAEADYWESLLDETAWDEIDDSTPTVAELTKPRKGAA